MEREEENKGEGDNLGDHKDVSIITSKDHPSAKHDYEYLMNSVSQPDLPATIPESTRHRMTSLGSQQDGDTQPFSPWVYEEHSNRTKALKQMTTTNRLSEGTNGTTSHTYSQGHSGHIDLVGAFEQPERVDADDVEAQNGDEIGGFSQADVRAEIYPESKRFQEPKTPATAGKKRNHEGEVVHSVGKTPSLPVNPFAGYAKESSGVMALSQVFQATQAASSPNAHVLPSEGPSERPSPAMYTVQRPSTAGSLSSPAKIPWTGLQRAVTEPQANYVSMQESQAERERQLRSIQMSSPVTGKTQFQDRSDDEFDSEESSHLMRRLNQKRIEYEAKRQFIGITARPRPASTRRNRDMTKVAKEGLSSSPVIRRGVPSAMIISDDIPLDDLEGSVTEDETEHEEDPAIPESESADELAEDNKENFDIHGTNHLTGTPKSARRILRANSIHSSPVKQRHLDLSLTNDGPDELSSAIDGPGSNERIKQLSSVPRGTQTVAVADSQPSQASTKLGKGQSFTRPLMSISHSSPESRMLVPQSQARQLPPKSPNSSSRARHLMENSSLNPAPSPVPAHDNNNHKMYGSSSSPIGSLDDRELPTVTSSESQQRKLVANFGSSPPRFLEQIKNADNGQPAMRTVIRDETLKTELEKVTSLSQSISEELPTIVDQTACQRPSSDTSSANHEARTPHKGSATLRSTIPETSSIVRRTTTDSPSHPSPDVDTLNVLVPRTEARSDTLRMQHLSKSSTLFDTAQTHLTNSPMKQRTQSLRNSSEAASSPTHLKTKMRRFSDIAAEPSSLNEVGEVDVDIGLMTGEDLNFQSIMEGSSPIGPIRKRRRGYGGRSVRVQEPVSSSAEHSKTTTQNPDILAEDNSSRLLRSPNQETPMAADKGLQQAIELDSPPRARVALSNVKSKNIVATRSQADGPAVGQTSSQTISPKSIEKADDVQVSNAVTKGSTKPTRIAISDLARRVEVTAITPNRVFAHFKGNYAGFYPATCLAVLSGEEPRYKVRFDDGTIDIVNAYGVRRLELRVGDVVKIDSPGARTQNYTVQGFRDREISGRVSEFDTPSKKDRTISSLASKFPPTDVFGHRTVLLAPKQKSVNPSINRREEQEAVPLMNIYLTKMLWNNFKDRSFTYRPSQPDFASGLHTPSDHRSTPSTPSTRSRRLKVSVQSFSSNVQPTTISRSGSRLFDNMVFSITNVEDQVIRQQVIRNIQHHGGYLLDSSHGFEELFDVPELEAAASANENTPDTSEDGFRLTPAAARRGFTCLVADKHCRSAKFIQALALGIPCLATRWVQDCINKQHLVPWEPYLLPSGESTFLGGAVRTRLLPSNSPESVRLSDIVNSRPKFLSGHSVLLIMGKGKEADMMKAYPFIAHALGAGKVARVNSLESARQALLTAEAQGEEWNWVYFYDGERAADKSARRHAESILFRGTGGGSDAGRKRKRGTEVLKDKKRKTRVVVTEFVIQSLILGTLMDGE